MDIKKLEQIGLSQGESKVYLALLREKVASKTKIVTKSQVSASKVYEILDRLIAKGLVATHKKNNVLHFSAANPKRLLDYTADKQKTLDQTKSQIEAMIPELSRIQDSSKDIFVTETYEGIKGVETAISELLYEPGHVYRAMGVSSKRNEVFNRVWFHWHAQRIKMKIPAELLFTEKASEYSDKLSKLAITKSRYAPWTTPATMGMYGNKVIIIDYKGELPVSVVITNKNMSQSMTEFFKSLWKIAT
jgi:sugar-specific transcriptional regulator TrmB